MAMTEVFAASTDAKAAADNTVACSGPTTFAITPNGLGSGEFVVLYGEDPAGTYTDEIYRFSMNTPASVNIETYRGVGVYKTTTKIAVGVDYGA